MAASVRCGGESEVDLHLIGDARLERRWTCPNCTTRAVTRRPRLYVPLHRCAGLVGVIAPLVELGVRCRVEAVSREDYVGRELVQRDANGRPVMAVVVTRDDGEDRVVLAPSATVSERT